MTTTFRVLAIALVVGLTWTPVRGQANAGQVFGVVTDESGVAIPGVQVTLNRPGDPAPRKAVSDAKGAYVVTAVPPGTYTVAFHLNGFFGVSKDDVVVKPDGRVEVMATLVPGLSYYIDTIDGSHPKPETLTYGETPLVILTSLGAIVIAVDLEHAPVTSANFLKYVNAHFYDGGELQPRDAARQLHAHAAEPSADEADSGRHRSARPKPTTRFRRFRSSARASPASSTSRARSRWPAAPARTPRRPTFFILLDDQPSLDFGGKRFDDEQGAAAFGRVIAGLDVVGGSSSEPTAGTEPANRRSRS